MTTATEAKPTLSDLTDRAVIAWQDAEAAANREGVREEWQAAEVAANLERVWECTWRLIGPVVAKFKDRQTATCGEDDLKSEGWIAIQKAAWAWRRGESRFSTYATRAIFNRLVVCVRATSRVVALPINPTTRRESGTEESKAALQELQDKAWHSGHQGEVFWNLQQSQANHVASLEAEEMLRRRAGIAMRLLDRLAERSPTGADVVRMQFGLGDGEPMRLACIDRKLGRKRSWAKDRSDYALHMLRKIAEHQGLTGVDA